jgi:tetratricopeptide (TPR) repeat protein
MARHDGLLGQAFQHYQAARTDEAANACQLALQARPNFAPALHLLGAIRLKQGAAADAVKLLERAARGDPRNPEILNTLGAALGEAGDVDGAIQAYERALRAKPRYAQASYNLGNALRGAGRLNEAIARYREAVALDANYTQALNNLGIALNEAGLALAAADKPEEAARAFQEALALAPDDPDIAINYGNVLATLHRPQDAVACFERALATKPDADGYANCGHALRQLGRNPDAIAAYDRAIALDPAQRDARFGRATALLTTARYTEGWRAYLDRDNAWDIAPRYHRAPLPADLTGARVLVEHDQGLGDEIFFLRFAAALRARGATAIYKPDPRLAAMLDRAKLVDRLATTSEPCTFRVLVGDLPYLLGMRDGEVPPPSIAVPPLPVETGLRGFGPRPYIGVAWRAGTQGARRRLTKALPLAALAAALRPVNATIAVVQRQPAPGELAAFAAALGRPVADLSPLNDDLEAMLALCGALDDLVCVSNTNVHFRAALGRNSRVLVPAPPEFRWMADGGESPWFPGSRVYRQAPDGGWDAALGALTRDLATK